MMSHQGKRKTKSLLDVYTYLKTKDFWRTLRAFPILAQFSKILSCKPWCAAVRQPVQPHTCYARLLVFDKP